MAVWSAFRTVSRACSLQNRCFESSRVLRHPLISKGEGRSRRVEAEELWHEQMFEFGASHKPIRGYGVRINICVGQQFPELPIDGHSALISTNATHEPITSGLSVTRPENRTRYSRCE